METGEHVFPQVAKLTQLAYSQSVRVYCNQYTNSIQGLPPGWCRKSIQVAKNIKRGKYGPKRSRVCSRFPKKLW